MLIVLVVVAVAAFMLLGGGLTRDSRDPDLDPHRYSPSGWLERLDGLFARTRDTLDLRRMTPRLMSGCTLQQRVLSFAGVCQVGIDTSRTKSSAFRLIKGSQSQVKACFAFSLEDLSDCWNDDKQRAEMKDTSRFVVTGDGAFLRFQCVNSVGPPCQLIVE